MKNKKIFPLLLLLLVALPTAAFAVTVLTFQYQIEAPEPLNITADPASGRIVIHLGESRTVTFTITNNAQATYTVTVTHQATGNLRDYLSVTYAPSNQITIGVAGTATITATLSLPTNAPSGSAVVQFSWDRA